MRKTKTKVAQKRAKRVKKYTISDLENVMNKLLAPGGCPWDREQTHKSLAPYAIEEAHELAEALETGDVENITEELGDFLFQVVFHCALAKNEKTYTLSDVIGAVCEKLIRRHPHVFGSVKVKNSSEVLKNWDQIKSKEKKIPKGVFEIPLSLPALQRAQKIGDKTKNLKFDWNNASEVFEKVDEEVKELKEAFASGKITNIKEELGDVFFVLAQLARHLKLEAEAVARQGNRKFEDRFKKLLALSDKKNLDFINLSTEKKEELWVEIKMKTRPK